MFEAEAVDAALTPKARDRLTHMDELHQDAVNLYLDTYRPTRRRLNLTALETAMREVRVQVQLHERPGWEWPFAETGTHWIAIGTHRDLNEAFRIALRNTIQFLVRRAGMEPLDAYALASLAVSFRITQVVDITQGVHAMIPKDIFDPSLRASIRIA